jgi:hypothetical protein
MGANYLHIYAYPWQPLTRFMDAGSERVIRYNPRKVMRCHECRDWRWAKYLKVQAYYDHWNIKCSDGCYGEKREHTSLR